MGKKSKSKGPPYTNQPEEKYVVIVQPFGMWSPAARKQDDYNRLGVWIRSAFKCKAHEIEYLLGMKTRTEVIAMLSPSVDVRSALGEHKWDSFWLDIPPQYAKMGHSSKVFEYHWRMNGDPAIIWQQFYPSQEEEGARGHKFKFPYPPPEWTEPPKGDPQLTKLVKPLPAELKRAKTTPPREDTTFRPYQPATHHPSHSLSLYAAPSLAPASPEASTSRLPGPPSKLEKLDPYESEATMSSLLGSEPAVQEDGEDAYAFSSTLADLLPETEPRENDVDEYAPTSALLDFVGDSGVEAEEGVADEYAPSSNLASAIAELEEKSGIPGSKIPLPQTPVSVPLKHPHDRSRPGPSKTEPRTWVKPEPEDVKIELDAYLPSNKILDELSSAPGGAHVVKRETDEREISETPTLLGLTASATNRRSTPSTTLKRVKEESEEYRSGRVKSIKLER